MSYLFQYKNDGVVLNTDVTPDEPFVDITKVSGLDNAPFRTTEREREGMDGGFVDAEFETVRTIVLEGTVYAGSDFDKLEPYMDSLKTNYAPRRHPEPFYFEIPGIFKRLAFAKSYGVKYDIDQARRIGSSPIQIQLIAEDPAIYSSGVINLETTLAVATTGRGYNRSFDYGYGPPIAGGRITITNAGNRPTGGVLTIRGPIEDPEIVHDISGNHLAFDITLHEEQYLDIDLRNRTVLLNGSANRRGSMMASSQWFLLDPGPNSLRFQGSKIAESPIPVLEITTRSAYR
jgi:hypothetical protein